MGPTCTVMVLPEPDKSLALFRFDPYGGRHGDWPDRLRGPAPFDAADNTNT
jgi:hypothetical protein